MAQQYYPTFDELLDMALCKDSTCFRKAAEKKGFIFSGMLTIPDLNGYTIVYVSPMKEADGSQNRLTWLFYNKKDGKSKYADFTTTNLPGFEKLMNMADSRGFTYLGKQSRDDEKGRLMMTFYYKNGATGLQSVISKTDTKNGEKELYSFSAKIPAGPKWPAEY